MTATQSQIRDALDRLHAYADYDGCLQDFRTVKSALDTQKPAGDAAEAFDRLVTGKDYLRAGQASAGGDWLYNRKDDVETVKNALSGTKRGDCHSKTGIKYQDAIEELQEIIADCDAHGTAAKLPLPVRVRVLCDVVIESAALAGKPKDGGDLFTDAYEHACRDAALCLGMSPADPPKSLKHAIGLIRGPNDLPQKQSIYATFARYFEKAREKALTADNAKRGSE